RSVELVSARLGHDIHDRARISPVFRFAAADHRDLSQRVDGQNGGRCAKYPSFVDGRIVAIPIVHVRAIEQVIVGAAAIAIGAEESEGSRRISLAAGIAGGPGYHD